MKQNTIVLPYIFLIFSFLLAGSLHALGGHHETLLEKVERKSVRSKSKLNIDKHLANIKREKAKVKGSKPFYVKTRKDEIKHFPCLECHKSSLAKLKKKSSKNKSSRNAHWMIQMQHASKETMNCKTCHDTKSMGNLKMLNGKKVGLNHAYKVCAQCHSSQFKDWKGGAHGKRLKGWVEPRVIKSCTGCHNPHKPSFEKRFPSWAPRKIHR